MIVIEIDGVQFGGFTSANVTTRLDALSSVFQFDATSSGAKPLPFSGGQACQVFADGELVLTGNIEVVSASYDSGNHAITFEGRDKTGDLLDSSLGGKGADGKSLSSISAPISLASICRRVIAHIGADIQVVDEANALIFSAAVDVATADPGDNAFEFLEKYSRKRQVLLSNNPQGDLLLAKPSGITIGGSIINRVGNPGNANNVIRADVLYDSTGRFNLYRAMSQLNTVAGGLSALFSATTTSDQGSTQQAIDDLIRVGRQKILVAEAVTSGKGTFDRASWDAKIQKARGRVYSPELSGFRDQTGELWRTNVLPQVVDEFVGIEARMLVNSVTFSNSLLDGSERVILGMVERDAYTLALQEPVVEDTDVVGGGGFFA